MAIYMATYRSLLPYPKDPITETEDSHNPIMRVFSDLTPIHHHVTMRPWIHRDIDPAISHGAIASYGKVAPSKSANRGLKLPFPCPLPRSNSKWTQIDNGY